MLKLKYSAWPRAPSAATRLASGSTAWPALGASQPAKGSNLCRSATMLSFLLQLTQSCSVAIFWELSCIHKLVVFFCIGFSAEIWYMYEQITSHKSNNLIASSTVDRCLLYTQGGIWSKAANVYYLSQWWTRTLCTLCRSFQWTEQKQAILLHELSRTYNFLQGSSGSRFFKLRTIWWSVLGFMPMVWENIE